MVSDADKQSLVTPDELPKGSLVSSLGASDPFAFTFVRLYHGYCPFSITIRTSRWFYSVTARHEFRNGRLNRKDTKNAKAMSLCPSHLCGEAFSRQDNDSAIFGGRQRMNDGERGDVELSRRAGIVVHLLQQGSYICGTWSGERRA